MVGGCLGDVCYLIVDSKKGGLCSRNRAPCSTQVSASGEPFSHKRVPGRGMNWLQGQEVTAIGWATVQSLNLMISQQFVLHFGSTESASKIYLVNYTIFTPKWVCIWLLNLGKTNQDVVFAIYVSTNHRCVQGWHLYHKWHITFYTHMLTFNAEVQGKVWALLQATRLLNRWP